MRQEAIITSHTGHNLERFSNLVDDEKVREDLIVDLNHIRITTRREWEALFRARSFKVERQRGWSILGASGDHIGVRARRMIDRWATKFPDLAYGLLFVLRKVDSTSDAFNRGGDAPRQY
jgi:hypothetical protein